MPEKWDDEEESSDASSSPPTAAATGPARRKKFDDEESEESDVLDAWDEAEDSEVEREKAKVAAEKKAKAEAEAAANKKSKTQRIAERQAANAKKLAESSEEESSEDEAEKRERLKRTEQEADLKHAEDLFGGVGGISNSRKAITAANAVVVDAKDPSATVDLTTLPLFDPKTKAQFEKLRDTLIPVLAANSQKPHYVIFLQEFTKLLAKDLPSEQIKKIGSGLTTLSNEKMKEEKAAEKGTKKSKAQKTKVALVASRNTTTTADTNVYDDDLEDDFM